MVSVRFLQMPYRVKGFVRQNEDDTYTIVLNSRLSYEQNVKTYEHEISHIVKGDFSKSDVNQIERSCEIGKR
jgi:hypothetical protein